MALFEGLSSTTNAALSTPDSARIVHVHDTHRPMPRRSSDPSPAQPLGGPAHHATRPATNDAPGQPAPATDALVRIQKYPNRRLYDRTSSRHLTSEQLHALVAEGRRVQVTDSRTGEDITNVVLAQLLLEHDPLKLAAFPPELLHLLIRSSHRALPSVQRIMTEATAGLARGWTEWQSWGERVAALLGGAVQAPGIADAGARAGGAARRAASDHVDRSATLDAGVARDDTSRGATGGEAPHSSAWPGGWPGMWSGVWPGVWSGLGGGIGAGSPAGAGAFASSTSAAPDSSGHEAARPQQVRPASVDDALEARLAQLQADVERLERALGQQRGQRLDKAPGKRSQPSDSEALGGSKHTAGRSRKAGPTRSTPRSGAGAAARTTSGGARSSKPAASAARSTRKR